MFGHVLQLSQPDFAMIDMELTCTSTKTRQTNPAQNLGYVLDEESRDDACFKRLWKQEISQSQPLYARF